MAFSSAVVHFLNITMKAKSKGINSYFTYYYCRVKAMLCEMNNT